MNVNRYKDAEFMQIEKEPILMVGLGGIGNGTAQHLLNIQQPFIVYDPDIVEEHNCIPQGYNINHIGKTKSECVYLQGINRNTGYFFKDNCTANSQYYVQQSEALPIMISAVDNMMTRQVMFNNWKEQEDRQLFIDGRLEAEFFQLFLITPEHEDWYEKNYLSQELIDSLDKQQGQCTYQQTSFVSAIIHGQIIQGLINHQLGRPNNYFIEYNGIVNKFRQL